ncbi:MAG: serine/threonine-protein kinase [Actinomycetota bacterium]
MDEPVEPLVNEPVKPGRRLGSNYVVGERLGRGAMGVVHEASTHDGRPLAVKFLRAELAADHKTVARFLQERQIFRKVDHPNVVRVHDLVAEGDDLAIVMERVSGGDLKQRIAERSLNPRQSIAIATGIAAGLGAIHQARVVHRDLKPANILLTPELSPKISDFGISRLVTEAMTRTSATIGTPIYMAPEAADQRGADAPADIYALGIILFELLIGQPPFSDGGTFAVLRAHAMDIPPRIDGIPTDLSDLIARMLAKEPTERPDVVEVHGRLAALIPRMDERAVPAAVPPPAGSGGEGFDSQETTGPRASGDPTVVGAWGAAGAGVGAAAAAGAGAAPGAVPGARPDESDERAGAIGAAGAGAGLAGLAASGALQRAGGDGVPADAAETVVGAEALEASDQVLRSEVAETVVDGGASAASGSADQAAHSMGNFASGSAETVVSSAGAGSGADGAARFGGLPGSGSTPDGVPYLAGPSGAATTGGLRSVFPNRVPRRVAEIGLAIGSLAAVLAIVAFVLNSGDGDGTTAIGSENTSTTGAAGPGVDGDGNGEDGPTQFSSSLADGENGDGGAAGGGGDGGSSTTATTDPTGGTSTETTSTTGGSSTSSSAGSSTSTTTSTTSSTTTSSSTSTTRPTTTSLSTTTSRPTISTTSTSLSTTTSSTAVVAVPIRIIAGPTVNVVNATSFQFNYTTNDVCGTGSFRVVEVESGATVGSFAGQDVCFGPLHGGFPGLASSPEFRNFNLEPATEYRVSITVRGTSPGSGDSLPAGAGSDSTSFRVTTAAG